MLDQLASRFSYTPETGELVWKYCPTKPKLVGSVAGSLHRSGYLNVNIGQRSYRVHRIIWLIVYGRWPVDFIDHINGIKTDNRLVNLREVSHSENMQNQRAAHKNNFHGSLGVTLRPNGKWQARITTRGVRVSLGCFCSKQEAENTYINAKKKQHISQELP